MSGLLAQNYEVETTRNLKAISKFFWVIFITGIATFSLLSIALSSTRDDLQGLYFHYQTPWIFTAATLPGLLIFAALSWYLIGKYNWMVKLFQRTRWFGSSMDNPDTYHQAQMNLSIYSNIIKWTVFIAAISQIAQLADMAIGMLK
ncbi:hypothetical protein AB4Y96_14555 [Phyllobacterium sp. TAF24]|uniref:hypothetical protein n=1 Tax=Phyllobacterium sp. TAF24 TaxID=3233068 RepID=UPI003F974343